MSTWTSSQRALAIPHLFDLAAKTVRESRNFELALDLVEQLRVLTWPHRIDHESDYREALLSAGLTMDEADAAVDAIARGEHPPTSLPGRVKRLLSNAENDGEEADAQRAHGMCDAYEKVFALLGCEVPK